MKLKKLSRLPLLALPAALALLPTAAASAQGTGYGPGTQYQVEFATSNAFGQGALWFWAALDSGGGGNYQEADCIHTGSAGVNGASHDAGNLNWAWVGPGQLELSGVNMLGGLETVDLTVSLASGTSGTGSIDMATATYAAGVPVIGGSGPVTLPAHGEVAP